MSKAKRKGALEGVRILDFSWVWAGPQATKMLGAMGAEVIKIETATRPEFTNRVGWFRVLNNNKKSCSIDIRHPRGQDLIRALAVKSDVVVENFSSGVLSKYGLGYEDLRRLCPDIVFLSASGVGRTGPQQSALAYGTLLQAYSGRAGMIGAVNPRMEAMGIQPAWTDPITALWEGVAILAALIHRRQSGAGAFIDLSMLESTVALLPEALLRQGLGLSEAGGNSEKGAAPCGSFRCAGEDAWLALSVRSQEEWLGLARAMRRPDLEADPRYADPSLRLAQKEALDGEVAAWLRGEDAAEAEALLQAQRVPAARARHIGELIEDPHVIARGLYAHLADGSCTTTLPWIDDTGGRGVSTPTPRLGADNEMVLGSLLGLSRERIEELVAAGAVR